MHMIWRVNHVRGGSRMRTAFKSLLAGAVASVAVMACAGGANAFSVTFDEFGTCIGCVGTATPVSGGGVSFTLPGSIAPTGPTYVQVGPVESGALSDVVTVSGSTLTFYSDPLFGETPLPADCTGTTAS